MEGEAGRKAKEKAGELKQAAAQAVAGRDGSSCKALAEVVQYWKDNEVTGEVTERKLTDMSEEEVDLIYRMHRLVGDRWELIAGRIPGRTPEEIKRFWKMKNDPCFAEKGLKRKRAVEGAVAEVQNQK
ncbi:hypothetical protein C4D60_Mb04t25550 [Musa balbisiana]|uniref:Uncharacterized protein n=1 Tax=Musa balbisiana TaxID=52838 RepID=A0A4S8KEL7_MUSBA|nr:hypothetical protein C4D60_Mb04t25550 [Musa balbisiana]